uniref:Uncharacterized protein n=1 Tax=Timema shepardi TaxID=629360 RepID=A0A7R9ANM6_TIMSH|nr:unnamed protein product [Timema shepardi]
MTGRTQLVLLHIMVLTSTTLTQEEITEECDSEMIGFELVTGYVFSAPGDLLDSLPGTLMLTDCLETCQGNESCQSINYETGLCVLFSSNADIHPGALTKSQFPVFTIYAQKSCLGVKPCERAWCFDRVLQHRLQGHVKREAVASSRQDCLEMCLGERDFICRSANYNNATGSCTLSDMDRLTIPGGLAQAADEDYLENHCVEQPTKLCEFKKLSGRILKTVDSVYQDVGSIDECRELCLNSPYRCHSYDFGDTGEMVCRLSHHSRATLSDIQEPYLDVPEASTHELSSCYNVTIECGPGDMVARIKTTKLFHGKIYAKGSPNSCAQDVRGSLEFALRMPYGDVECNVRQQGLGRYLNDVVIQHHDTIVTSSDLGLAVTCQYDLTNKSVSNEVDLGVRGDVRPALSEEVVVDSPNVAMKITDRKGADLSSAEVGDPLALRFQVLDKDSPYEIFVRELVALDGVDSSEIVLIDSDGCPTDQFIMGPIYKALDVDKHSNKIVLIDSGGGLTDQFITGPIYKDMDVDKILISNFDAFKFPSSEVVQFRALVTPCLPSCEPVQCDLEDATGELRAVSSLGRRRRRSTDGLSEDMLLVQAIHIRDKFGFDRHHQNNSTTPRDNSAVFVGGESPSGTCLNVGGVVAAGGAFLAAELALLLAWAMAWRRHRLLSKLRQDTTTSSGSLCKLYDSGYAHRY